MTPTQRDAEVFARHRIDQRGLGGDFHGQRLLVRRCVAQVGRHQARCLLLQRLLGFRRLERHVLGVDRRPPRFQHAAAHVGRLQRDAQVPMAIERLQAGMHHLAQEQARCRRLPDAFQVLELERQRASEPLAQAAGADVRPDAALAGLQFVAKQSLGGHGVAAPPNTASRSISPALMPFKASIRPDASRLVRPATGLANIFWARASSRRTPRPLMWPASCRT